MSASGPFTIASTVQGWVVDWMALRLKRGSHIARVAATTTSKWAGSHPAITALTASLAAVPRPRRGSTTPISVAGSQPPSMASNRSRVGGTMGSPSVQPRWWKIRFTASSDSGARTVSGASGAL